jgi:hypothetical protein
MIKLKFSTDIKSPKDKVWSTLWDDKTYRSWTSAYSEGSYAVSDWNEGSKILFLSPEGEGMFSMIAKKTPNEYMSFKHLGVVKEGKEQPSDAETEKWAGAMENYTLKDIDGGTQLTVEMDITEDHATYFSEAFPKALNKVKELAENLI